MQLVYCMGRDNMLGIQIGKEYLYLYIGSGLSCVIFQAEARVVLFVFKIPLHSRSWCRLGACLIDLRTLVVGLRLCLDRLKRSQKLSVGLLGVHGIFLIIHTTHIPYFTLSDLQEHIYKN